MQTFKNGKKNSPHLRCRVAQQPPSKVSPTESGRGESNCTVEKLKNHDLSQVIEVNINSDKQC